MRMLRFSQDDLDAYRKRIKMPGNMLRTAVDASVPPPTPRHSQSPAKNAPRPSQAVPAAGESLLAQQLALSRIPGWQTQYRFLPPRRFRADFAWPQARLLVEVDGGGWMTGRHHRGPGYRGDRVRDALAMIADWRVLRVTPEQVASGEALGWIKALLTGP